MSFGSCYAQWRPWHHHRRRPARLRPRYSRRFRRPLAGRGVRDACSRQAPSRSALRLLMFAYVASLFSLKSKSQRERCRGNPFFVLPCLVGRPVTRLAAGDNVFTLSSAVNRRMVICAHPARLGAARITQRSPEVVCPCKYPPPKKNGPKRGRKSRQGRMGWEQGHPLRRPCGESPPMPATLACASCSQKRKAPLWTLRPWQ